MNRLKALAFCVLPLLLTSCIDTQNVNTFAASVAVVTNATTQMVAADRMNCSDINATLTELAALPLIKPLIANGRAATCTQLGSALDLIAGLNNVMANYGKALNAISQGTVTNYDSDVSTLQTIVKGLPANLQPTSAQTTALTGLAGWVASLVTDAGREKALNETLVGKNDEMANDFHTIVAWLQALMQQYSDGLYADEQITRDGLKLINTSYAPTEPVAVNELTIKWTANIQADETQKSAVMQYKDTLTAMDKAFDAVAQQPTAKAILGDVQDFAKQATGMYQNFEKAFPKS